MLSLEELGTAGFIFRGATLRNRNFASALIDPGKIGILIHFNNVFNLNEYFDGIDNKDFGSFFREKDENRFCLSEYLLIFKLLFKYDNIYLFYFI